MDFAALPPEINSARMYSGPGATSLLTAATAWGNLASELSTSASSCSSAIAELTTSAWQGPTSTRMADAAQPYVAWLHATASQATQVAAQTKAAAAAYETAFTATVPPPLIEANRASLTALTTTNFFGQNSPAIAVTEAEYDGMWAQDAATMYQYAASSASVTQLTPFAPPPQTTNPAGSAAQTAAVAQAVAAGAGNAQNATVSPGLSAALQGLIAPAANSSSSLTVPVIAGQPITSYLLQLGNYGRFGFSINNQIWRLISLGTRLAGWQGSALRDFANGVGPFSPLYGIPLPPAGAISSAPAVAVSVGQASQVSTLSVPPSWAATITAAELTPTASAVAATPAVAVGQTGSAVLGDTLLGTLAGRAISAAASRSGVNQTRQTNKVIPATPAGG